ncbi:hypothetical protein C8A05DRAFT_12111 [Staphylotrichum tortipilum]|uniref:Uncharacterized protein n=1 Tax=Staphylotrichum tortipilum TaxID=2831512 RepID=A0AAN6MT83_9PEZI|nr:hypothetical protein C8A05DRAFT_12111 [Staphylotrichum longicolle]
MVDTHKDKGVQASANGDLDQAPLRTMPTAAFIGYCPFPPVMNLYVNYSFLFSTLKSYKLCGATENDFIYLVEYHLGYTPRGPLNFGRGLYLRNGTSFTDPILTATGEEFPIPLLVSLFDPDTIVKLPPLDMDKSPRDMVNEVLRAGTSKGQGVTFKFTVEVGVKRIFRESFEWRKCSAAVGGKSEGGSHTTKSWYTLHRFVPSHRPPPTSASATKEADNDCETLAVLTFNRVLSFTHQFTLELKGAGLTGELGDRWTLMVVTSALGLLYLRSSGKTGKATVGAAQAIHGK